MVSLLLEKGADPSISDKTGRNALAIARYMNKDGVIKILKEYSGMNGKEVQKQLERALHDLEQTKLKLMVIEKECNTTKKQWDLSLEQLREIEGQKTSLLERLSEKEKDLESTNMQSKQLEIEKDTALKQLISTQAICNTKEDQLRRFLRELEQEKNRSKQLEEKFHIQEIFWAKKSKTDTLHDLLSHIRKDLFEIKSFDNYHVNFNCFSTYEIQKEMKFLFSLSKDISDQVVKVIEGSISKKNEIEIYVAEREKKRCNIITLIQNLKNDLKKEDDVLCKIQHVLIFENKLDSKRLDELCSMRSKLIEMNKELDLKLLTIPNHLQECTHKIDQILQHRKELEEKEEELHTKKGNIMGQFKNNSPEYKSQMSKLENHRNTWKENIVKLEITKQEMIKGLIHYPELRFKLEEEQTSDDPYQSFKNYLKSVNLLVELNVKDHFPTRENFKRSLHLLKCTNLQEEPKFLKKFVVSDPKTLNEIQLLMLFNHPHIIKPELAFIDDGEVYLQFPFFEQTLKDWIKNKSISEKRIMFFKILQTLSHIHSKFVMHRDIKFDNILVKNDEPVIIDFGIGKRDVMMQTGTIRVGTAYFMAPETEFGKNTFASDIWSVGVMLYDAFYGSDQFGGNLREDIQFPKISGDDEGTMVGLLKRILLLDSLARPSASDLLLDPFFLSDERKRMINDKMILDKSDKMKLFFESLPKISGYRVDICVPRLNVIDKIVDMVSKMNEMDLLKQWNVRFDNETGYGVGLTRELFTLFFDQLFKKTTLWKHFDESALVIPSDQEEEPDDRIWNVIGKMMLMVLLHRIPVPSRFSSFVYRFLIGDESNLSLLYKEVMELEPQHAKTTIQLKPTDDLSCFADYNKDEKEVTAHNLTDFKKHRFESILIPNEICLTRLKEMRKGFQTIELKELQTKITSFELRDILGGVPMMDPNELWYQMDASRLDETTRSFFKQAVMEMTSDKLRQLLYWITCLSALPMNGLEKKIQLVSSHQGFNAHTCFFQLEVYNCHNKYEDFKKTLMASLEQAQVGVFVEY